MTKQIAAVFTFPSESSPGKTYQALVYDDGSTSCECRAWIFKKKTTATGERTCRHVREIEAGTANLHALSVVEYSVPAKRPKQQPVQVPENLPMRSANTLNFAPKRAFDFGV